MDGITILNEIEIVQVVNDTFNYTAGSIAFCITILICAIAGFFIGGIDFGRVTGTLIGALLGVLLGLFAMALFGSAFSYPPETETTMQYEVTIDDSVSLTEFYEQYNVIEQRGEIFVVEKKDNKEN